MLGLEVYLELPVLQGRIHIKNNLLFSCHTIIHATVIIIHMLNIITLNSLECELSPVSENLESYSSLNTFIHTKRKQNINIKDSAVFLKFLLYLLDIGSNLDVVIGTKNDKEIRLQAGIN